MSNLYVSRHGISLPRFQEDIQTLIKFETGSHPACGLGVVEPKVLQRDFNKVFMKVPRKEVLDMIPVQSKEILSIGCGWARPNAISQKGAQVVAVPSDSVIGEVAARQRSLEWFTGHLVISLE